MFRKALSIVLAASALLSTRALAKETVDDHQTAQKLSACCDRMCAKNRDHSQKATVGKATVARGASSHADENAFGDRPYWVGP